MVVPGIEYAGEIPPPEVFGSNKEGANAGVEIAGQRGNIGDHLIVVIRRQLVEAFPRPGRLITATRNSLQADQKGRSRDSAQCSTLFRRSIQASMNAINSASCSGSSYDFSPFAYGQIASINSTISSRV